MRVETKIIRSSDRDIKHANLDTDITIKLITLDFGESFSISCRTRSEKAVFAADYADVHSGEWLGLENAKGNLQLAISYGDAADVLNCSVDDAITITF
jgi:S-adenosylmethionine hydrolase